MQQRIRVRWPDSRLCKVSSLRFRVADVRQSRQRVNDAHWFEAQYKGPVLAGRNTRKSRVAKSGMWRLRAVETTDGDPETSGAADALSAGRTA